MMRVSQRLAAILMAGGLCFSLAVVASAAARAGNGGHGVAAISQSWFGRLNLSADQQAKVQAASMTLKADTAKARSLTSPPEKRQTLRQARDSYRAAIQAVLTPEQQTQLAAMQAEAKEFHALGAVGTELVGLNLTNEQKEKIKAIAAKYQPDVQRLHASLKDAADKKAVRGQIRELHQKLADEVKAVLTPDQVARLQLTASPRRAAR